MTWPAPEVACRLAEPGEVPTGARRVAAVAQRGGWRVVATYARGTWPAYRVPRVVDNLALRMWFPDGARAVAVWLDGKYEQGWAWGLCRPLQRVNARELRWEVGG